MKKRILAVLMVAALAVGMVACSSSSDTTDDTATTDTADDAADDADVEEEVAADPVKVAVLLKPESNEYWSAMKAGIEEWAADRTDVVIDYYFAESEDNITGQLEQMENIISMDYDAICAAPLSASNLVEGVIKACEEGIVVVNVDEGIDIDAVVEGGGNMAGLYTTDNVLVGEKGAEYIVSEIETGEVAIIEGTSGNITSNQRTEGATTYFESVDGIEVVSSQPGDWDRLTAMDVATNIMTSNPDLKAFYCANDTMALGVQEAVVNAGLEDQIIVVGTDGTSNGIQSVADGEMASSVGQDNVGIGIACVELAIEAVNSGWVADPTVEMPTEYIDSFLITIDNAADYLS